ncbi:hypothetical protein [Tsukamurella strandjordii]|uniref:Uncharacterized protein n=1 Tax=Tsukamurella strandjordii TaxID=147577 RepID=A0AA90NR04_9ACTN|nr:hypothetical protein [Tsukamurella strandjordii]MDP0399139.1 hypothetical protein [Tsukamurella strandjordii]
MATTRGDDSTVSALIRRQPVAIGIAAFLTFCFLVAPRQIVGTGFDARAAREFPPYIAGGAADLTPGLRALVDDWSRYHLIKAVFAGLLVVLALYLGHRALALIPAVLLIANVQGSLAPLSSAFSLLGSRVSESDGPLAESLGLMRRRLAAGEWSPPIDALVNDFAWYHLVLVIMAGALTILVLTFAVRDWHQDRRGWALATLVVAVGAGIVAAANVSTALEPARGLLDFLGAP